MIMALNGNQMGSEVAAALAATAPGGQLDGSEQAVMTQQWQVICTAIVNHIKTNGHAVPGTFLDSQGGGLTGKGDLE